MAIYFVAIMCVVGIAVGQLLFKSGAMSWSESGNVFGIQTLSFLLGAVALYGVTSVAWVWVLQKLDLGRAYPIMALAFVLVPVGSYLVFGERFPPRYALGVLLIVGGMMISARA